MSVQPLSFPPVQTDPSDAMSSGLLNGKLTARRGQAPELKVVDPEARPYRADTDYVLKEQIGRGEYATVRRCMHRRSTESFALKIIDKKANQDSLHLIEQEIKIMRRLGRHRHVVQLYEVYEDPYTIELVLDFIPGGELFEVIVEKGFFSENDASWMIHQVLEGILHIHSKGIVHRDLKPENLLCMLAEDGKLSSIVICDFGVAAAVPKGANLSGLYGSPDYISPEMHKGMDYTYEPDMWSLGIISYIILAGYPPFSEDEAEETGVPLKELILEKPIEFPEEEWVDISDDAKDFIRRLLERDPAKRMRAKEALMHPFVGGGRKYSIVHDDSHMAIVEQLRKQLDLEASSANSTPRDPTSPRDATGVDPLSDSESGSAASSLVRPRTGTLTAPPPSVPTPPNPKEQEASQKRAQKLKKFTAKRRFAGAAAFFKGVFGADKKKTAEPESENGSKSSPSKRGSSRRASKPEPQTSLPTTVRFDKAPKQATISAVPSGGLKASASTNSVLTAAPSPHLNTSSSSGGLIAFLKSKFEATPAAPTGDKPAKAEKEKSPKRGLSKSVSTALVSSSKLSSSSGGSGIFAPKGARTPAEPTATSTTSPRQESPVRERARRLSTSSETSVDSTSAKTKKKKSTPASLQESEDSKRRISVDDSGDSVNSEDTTPRRDREPSQLIRLHSSKKDDRRHSSKRQAVKRNTSEVYISDDEEKPSGSAMSKSLSSLPPLAELREVETPRVTPVHALGQVSTPPEEHVSNESPKVEKPMPAPDSVATEPSNAPLTTTTPTRPRSGSFMPKPKPADDFFGALDSLSSTLDDLPSFDFGAPAKPTTSTSTSRNSSPGRLRSDTIQPMSDRNRSPVRDRSPSVADRDMGRRVSRVMVLASNFDSLSKEQSDRQQSLSSKSSKKDISRASSTANVKATRRLTSVISRKEVKEITLEVGGSGLDNKRASVASIAREMDALAEDNKEKTEKERKSKRRSSSSMSRAVSTAVLPSSSSGRSGVVIRDISPKAEKAEKRKSSKPPGR